MPIQEATMADEPVEKPIVVPQLPHGVRDLDLLELQELVKAFEPQGPPRRRAGRATKRRPATDATRTAKP
jgi:hypothetical protein